MGHTPKSLLLDNARIVTIAGLLENVSVLLANGRIAEITNEAPVAGDYVQTDLSGLTLYPGFIDVHIHGAVGIDTLSANSGDLENVSRFLSSKGVTAWLPTLVPAAGEVYESAIGAIDRAMNSQHESAVAEVGARVLGVHYEGPFVSTLQCGALHSEYFKTFSSMSDLAKLPIPTAQHSSKMMTMAPETAGGIELIRELVKQEWVVSLGHTSASTDLLDQALAAGASHMTHFMNAMPPLHHRSPGPVGWGLAHSEVSCDVIADGVHIHPEVLRLLCSIKSPDRLLLISDAIAAAGKGDGDYDIWGETITVRSSRTSNAHGSIAGSVSTMLDAVKMMLSLGISEIDVAKMAATNPARLMGSDNDCGSIAAGKRADLVALDANGDVKLTIVGGEVAFTAS